MSPQPPSPRPIEEAPLEQRLAAWLSQQMERVLDVSGPAIVGSDEDAIHKLRVSLRRARSVFRTFASFFPEKARKRAERPLKKIGRLLGSVRDLDALLERIESDELSSLRSAHPEGAEALATRLALERKRRAAELPGKVDHEDLAAALRSVERAIDSMKISGVHPREEAGGQVMRYLSEAEPLLRKAARQDEHDAQHELRIETKRLRYALEVLEPLLDGAVKTAVEAAREVQDRLGLLQDLTVLGDLCVEVAPDFPALTGHLEQL